MSKTSVRSADPAEYSALTALTALYEAWGYRAGIAPTDVVYVAERSGRIVGIVRRSGEEGLTLLRGMYVHPSARSTGIGTLLGFATVREAEMPAPLALRLNRYRREGHDVVLMLRDPDSQVHDRAG